MKLPSIQQLLFATLFALVMLVANAAFAQPGLQNALEAQRAHNKHFFENDEVVATGISVDENGNAIIKVYTLNQKKAAGVPEFVNGVKVKQQFSGPIFAGDNPIAQAKGGGKGKPGGGDSSTNPRTRQARPVPIGVSIGSTGPNYCFAGTLGCRLKGIDLTNGSISYFILSNNHVLADENNGQTGVDEVIQPGTLDNGCVPDSADVIAELTDFETIRFDGSPNFVDAAIAITTTAHTGFASPAEAYGAPASSSVTATVGLPVKKFGRTTGFTEGVVDAINLNVNVGYAAGNAYFVNQIAIVGQRQRGKRTVAASFSDSGDSGSLIVSGNNQPVGLLFAGNSSITIANPIDTVLDTFSTNNRMLIVDDGN